MGDALTKSISSSPFTGLDTITTNDWWNRKGNPIIDTKVHRDSVIAFAAYTTANETLRKLWTCLLRHTT